MLEHTHTHTTNSLTHASCARHQRGVDGVIIVTVIIGMASVGPLAYVSYEYHTTLTSFASPVRAPQPLAAQPHHHQPPFAIVGSQLRATLGIARIRCSTSIQTIQSPASPRRVATRFAARSSRTCCKSTENSSTSRRGTSCSNHRSATLTQPSPNGTARSTRRGRNRPRRQSIRTSFASSAPAPRLPSQP